MADQDSPKIAMGTNREILRKGEIRDGERLVPPVGLVDGDLSFDHILIATLNVRGLNYRPKFITIIKQLANMNY